MNSTAIRTSLFIVFTLSGFTGLIYESIWTQYLKLVLGHAAYSQTLVLLLFMGGMAIGSWLVSRVSARISRPVMAYAAIELVIGLLAVVFHDVFVFSQDLLFDQILPGIGSAQAAGYLRWIWAAILILPQSILLGATFPLMSAGIIRLFPNRSGSILATLYFSNSVGAAVGVLVSGFVLIDLVGLPGTILTAGLLNVMLALVVWAITKQQPSTAPITGQPDPGGGPISAQIRVLLAASFLTGLASFFYEIAWIRMLDLVLGTTTQSFELMLSAFITGIAFGGLWIRKRIDKIDNVLMFSGYVQIIMGLLAALTIVLYNSTFDLMQVVMQGLQRNESGYDLFIISSHLLAFAVMVPTTFMAGMTLPLFTYSYMKQDHGEKGIGRIYSANTVGSIVGIIIAVHLVMPQFGLKNLVALGSLVDIVLGVVLIYLGLRKQWSMQLVATVATSVVIFSAINLLIEFDKGKMASGLYRYGRINSQAKNIVFMQDGKTATIVVEKIEGGAKSPGAMTIKTNGKTDAGISLDPEKYAPDEPTMALLAMLPLATHANAKTAAVIGMGSGITSNALLMSDRLQRVDTIEIEPAVIEGARLFGDLSARVFSDPRSHIEVDDAKAYFSVNNKKYDLIVSEPSNPWVSGVANLFSQEFYRQIKKHLNSGGVLTQWLQVYEINHELMFSVFKALNREFKYFVVYQTLGTDVIIVASNENRLTRLDPWIFTQANLSKYLARLDITRVNDLYARTIGDQSFLNPIFETVYAGVQPNSDFFPILSRRAPKARFLNQNGIQFLNLPYQHYPLLDFLRPLPKGASRFDLTPSERYGPAVGQQQSELLYDWLVTGNALEQNIYQAKLEFELADLEMFVNECYLRPSLPDSLTGLAQMANTYLPAEKAHRLWSAIEANACFQKLGEQDQKLIALYKAAGARNTSAMMDSANEILARFEPATRSPLQNDYFYTAMLIAMIAEQRYDEARDLVQKIVINSETNLSQLLLIAIADPERLN
ncbi:MAG TPA: MFS transporter [Gammaproteobacteria bacterium]|nr:MFS transporter [Gammaproteobacteria bacterium]